MFAGGSTRFLKPILIGDMVERHAEIVSIDEKEGKSGPLVFVDVRYSISTPAGLALEEDQTIVYTDTPPKDTPSGTGTPPEASWHREVCPDPPLLFRFSALTFNAHRIHYDTAYATTVEGYAKLVVQGPLVALLLLGLGVANSTDPVAEFKFRAQSPFHVGDSLHLRGEPTDDGATLAAYACDGRQGMRARLTTDTSL
jgi:3-methylfumaryl-CoA hydratase